MKNPLMPLVKVVTGSGSGSSSTRKRKFRYRVAVKGTTISRHYTRTAASKAAKSISGARVVAIGTARKSTARPAARRRRY